jgi:hypothetical protein
MSMVSSDIRLNLIWFAVDRFYLACVTTRREDCHGWAVEIGFL